MGPFLFGFLLKESRLPGRLATSASSLPWRCGTSMGRMDWFSMVPSAPVGRFHRPINKGSLEPSTQAYVVLGLHEIYVAESLACDARHRRRSPKVE